MAGTAGGIRAGYAFIELSAINNVNKELDKVTKQVKKFTSDVSDLAKIPLELSVIGFIPAVAMEKTFMDFDDQMRLVAAVSDATGDEFERLTEQAKRLGKTTSWTAIQVAEGMTALGRIGFTASQISAAVPNVMNLARATGVDLANAAELTGSVMNQFGLKATDTQRIVDVLAIGANASAADIDSLRDSLKFAAPVAKQFGASLEDTILYISTMSNYGINGSTAGTSMRQMFERLGDPKIRKAIKDNLDVDVTTASGEFRDFGDIVADLGNQLKNLPNADQIAILHDIFGIYAVSGASVLTTADFSVINNQLKNAAGTAAEVAKEMDAGLGGSFRLAKSALEGFALAVGEALAPKLMEIGKRFQEVAQDVINWVNTHQESVVEIAKGVAQFLALSAAAYGFTKSINIAAKAVDVARQSFSAYWKFLTFITGATKAYKTAVEALKAVEAAEAAVTAARTALLQSTSAAQAIAAATALAQAQADYNLAVAEHAAAAGAARMRVQMAMIGGIVTIIAAVAASVYYLGGAYERASKKAEEATEKAREQANSVGDQFQKANDLIGRLKELESQQSLNNEEMAEAEGIIGVLTAQYGDLGLSVDKATGSIKGLSNAQKELRKQELEAKIQAKQVEIQSRKDERSALGKELDVMLNGATFSATHIRHGFNDSIGQLWGAQTTGERVDEINTKMRESSASERVAQAELDSLTMQLQALNAPKQLQQEEEKKDALEEADPNVEDFLKEVKYGVTSIYSSDQLASFNKRLSEANQFILAAQTAYNDAIKEGDPEKIAEALKTVEKTQEFKKNVDEDIKFEKVDLAKAAFDEALKSGDNEKIDVASKEMERVVSDITEIMNARAEADKNLEKTEKSVGTFDAFNVFDLSMDWQRTEMRAQTEELKDINEQIIEINDTLAELRSENTEIV